MAYEKQTWVDGTTPVDAEHLDHMEDGIAANADDIDTLSADLTYKDVTSDIEITSENVMSLNIGLYANKYEAKIVNYFRLAAGEYTTSDILMMFPVKPPTQTQFIIYSTTGKEHYLFQLTADGRFRFNTATTLSSNSYFYPNVSFTLA